jgi:transcription-repair coupling factor (superfamily II helicase)
MTLKNETLRCHFINNPESPYFESQVFNRMLEFIQTALNKARLKQTGKLFLLVIEDVKAMEALLLLLQRIQVAVVENVPTE